MRINGNFFNFRNSSFFSSSSMVSKLFGSRNAGSVNKYSQTYMKDGVLYHIGSKNADRNRMNKHSQTYMKDGVLYQKGNRPESKLYTRRETWADVRPNQRSNRRNAFHSVREDLAKVHFDAALGKLEPKQMSVKDNEVRFDNDSYYQFTGKDGKLHTVLSAGSVLSADEFTGKGRIDEEAAEYANFWMRLAHSAGTHAKYSQADIRSKLEEAGIQNGFFTVTVGKSSATYFLSQKEDAVALRSKEAYDKQYNALVSGEAFKYHNLQPGQTVTVGGKDYVLNENKGIDIEYGAEIY